MLGPANRAAIVNGDTDEVKKYLLVGQRVWHAAFTPDEKLLVTTNGSSNDVSVIDVESLKVVKSIGVGRYPWGVVVGP
jgi:YVTN family beta-propeller protein